MTTTAFAPAFSEPANDRTAPLRILLVEDNETMRRLIGFVLRSDGHAISEVRDGTELLEALATSVASGPEGAFDVIVSEQTMTGLAGPTLDGLTILAGLRARGVATPFVLITAEADVQQRARRLGAIVLDQPFNTRAIRNAVVAASTTSTRASSRSTG